MKKILICGSSSINRTKIKKHLDEIDFIIAADGGFDRLKSIGVLPDLVLGDMDSIKKIPENVKTNIFPLNKDKSDLELSIEYAIKKFDKIEKIIVDGVTGYERPDHTFSNFLQFTNSKINFLLFTSRTDIYFLNKKGSYSFDCKKNTKISIIETKKGEISGNGLKFKLPQSLKSYTHGISNQTQKTQFKIHISKGKWILIVFN